MAKGSQLLDDVQLLLEVRVETVPHASMVQVEPQASHRFLTAESAMSIEPLASDISRRPLPIVSVAARRSSVDSPETLPHKQLSGCS
jgi:hypothetical protein